MKNGKPTEVNKGAVTEDEEDDRTISEGDFRVAPHHQTKLTHQQEQVNEADQRKTPHKLVDCTVLCCLGHIMHAHKTCAEETCLIS